MRPVTGKPDDLVFRLPVNCPSQGLAHVDIPRIQILNHEHRPRQQLECVQELNQVIELIEKGGLESILAQEILRVCVTTGGAENGRILPFPERLFIASRSQFDQNNDMLHASPRNGTDKRFCVS